MNVTWANLKLALLRDKGFGLLMMLLVFAVFYWLYSDVFAYAIIIVASANPFSCTHRDIAGRPFSFCLPGYRNQARAMILADALIGGLAGIAAGVLLFLSEGWTWPIAVGCSLAGFFVGAVYSMLSGSSSVYPFVLAPVLARILSFPFCLVVFVAGLAVFACPWLIWPVAILACLGAWTLVKYKLGGTQYVAHAHRMVIKEAMAERRQANDKRIAPSWADFLFLDWAERFPHYQIDRYVWASFYQAFGRMLSYWPRILGGVLAASLILVLPLAETVFILLGLLVILVDLPVTFSMSLPMGRPQRWTATLAVVVAASFLVVALALGAGTLFELIAMTLGASVQSLGFRFRSAWLACVPVPWIAALKLRPLGPFRFEKSWMAVLTLAIALTGASAYGFGYARQHALVIAGIAACGWIVFLIVLKLVCTKGSLVALGSSSRCSGRA